MSSSNSLTIASITSFPVITPKSFVKIFAIIIILIRLTIIFAQSKHTRDLCTNPICSDIIFRANSFLSSSLTCEKFTVHQDYLSQFVSFFIKLKIYTNISYYKNHKGIVDSVILIFLLLKIIVSNQKSHGWHIIMDDMLSWMT